MDDEATAALLDYAKLAVGHEHGLSDNEARRLNGRTVDELHRDATAMCRELGRVDLTERARDRASGQFVARDMNVAIRQAAGR
jgi:predicted transcriptional regulator